MTPRVWEELRRTAYEALFQVPGWITVVSASALSVSATGSVRICGSVVGARSERA